MSNQNAFPTYTLSLAVATTAEERSDSLDGVNTTTMESWVLGAVKTGPAANRLFYLDRADNTTPPDGTTVVAPLAGPGRWKLLTLPGAGPAPSSASFSPTADQEDIGPAAETYLNLMGVQDYQDNADWTQTDVSTLTSTRTGRYKFTFLWSFLRTAGNQDEGGTLGLYVNNSLVRLRQFTFPFIAAIPSTSFQLTCQAPIASGDTVRSAIGLIDSETFTLLAPASFVIIERMS